MSINIYTNPSLVIKTESEWAVDATIYTNKKILVTSDEYWDGTTTARKFKISDGINTWINIEYPPIGAVNVNTLYNADDSLSSNRTIDNSGFNLSWTNVKQVSFTSFSAPTSGNASYSFQGYGVGSTDKLIDIKNGSSVSVLSILGDKTANFNGSINLTPGERIILNSSSAYVSKASGANGLLIFGNGGSWVFGNNSGQIRATGDLGGQTMILQSDNSDNYFDLSNSDSSSYWRFGKNSNEWLLAGITAGGYYEYMRIRYSAEAIDFKSRIKISTKGYSGSDQPSAVLQLESTTQGFLPPRMTLDERDDIVSPATGLMVRQSDNTPGIYVFNGTIWDRVVMVSEI